MKLVIVTPVTSLLLMSALVFGLSACNSSKSRTSATPPVYRYDAQAISPSFIGTSGFQQGQLNSLLKDNQRADPLTFLVGANTALKQGRLTDAGLLYQQAQIRRLTDLQRYPPKPDAQAQVKNVLRLKANVSAALGPKLLEQPKVYAQIAQRLQRWHCDSGIGYVPSWPYSHVVKDINCAATQQQKVRLMRDLSVLLSQPDYASAAQLAEYYQNSSSSVRELSGLKEGYLKALSTMRKIERQQKRIGLSDRF